MAILTTEERIGSRLSARYRLDAVLASGGMGVLFSAVDESMGRPVAVKMLKPAESAEPARVARFGREARIAGTLAHPNIATFLDSGFDESRNPYIVMELLDGMSLEQLLVERGTLPFDEALPIVAPIARALVAAHARGVVHRDVKPSNIFLARDASGTVTPKLLDFGIARSRKDDFETGTGSFVGTLGYIAPEQAMNRECGPFTDVWATGAVLYRCLTGAPPHAGGSVPEVLARLVHKPVPSLVVTGLRRSTCATIDRALARNPDDRQGTMQAFIEALEGSSIGRGECGETSEMPGATVTVDTSPELPVPPRSGSRESRRSALVASAALVVGASLLSFALGSSGTKLQVPGDAIPLVHVPKATLPATAVVASVEAMAPALAATALEPSTSVARPSVDPSRTEARRVAAKTNPARPPRMMPSSALAGSSTPQPERERKTGLPVATEW